MWLRMPVVDLNLLDELYLHLDRPEEPWSVHLEVAVEGSFDLERLRAAIASAADRHPLARARLREPRGTDVRYHWDIDEQLDELPLEERDCADDAALDCARSKLLSRNRSLERSPPFALTLAHGPDGDALILNLHHAAGDGISALRLMGSILRAYGREEDPLPAVDPLAVRDVSELAGAQSLADRARRTPAALEYAARVAAPPVRIAPDGASDRGGYGFRLLELDVGAVRRRDGATVNDSLIAALAVTVRRWNERHDAPAGTIHVMMPINLRPSEWRLDVVGNFASYVTVQLGGDEHGDLERATAAVAARTARIKEAGIGGLILDLFEAPAALPIALKRQLQRLIPLTGDLVVDTAVLSNLGRLEGVPRLGGAGPVRAVWFSPPGRMPLGASVGVATLDERVFLTLRYRHALFDAHAAKEFGELLRGVATG